jgi:hypothetical protein
VRSSAVGRTCKDRRGKPAQSIGFKRAGESVGVSAEGSILIVSSHCNYMEYLSCFASSPYKTIRVWVCRRSLDFCHCDSGAALLQLVIVRIYESKKRVLICPSRSRLFWWIGSCSCNFQSSKTMTGVLRAGGTGAVRGDRREAKRNKWKGPACGE